MRDLALTDTEDVISPGMGCFPLVGSSGIGFWVRGLDGGLCPPPPNHARPLTDGLRVASLHRTSD